MTWQRIAHLDPFLAGSIAAGEWERWQEITVEQLADSVSLTGEQRNQFRAGWQTAIDKEAQERREQMMREYDDMGKVYKKGDPAYRSW